VIESTEFSEKNRLFDFFIFQIKQAVFLF